MKIFILGDEALSTDPKTGKPWFLHRVPKENVNEEIQKVAEEAKERMGDDVAVVVVLVPVENKSAQDLINAQE